MYDYANPGEGKCNPRYFGIRNRWLTRELKRVCIGRILLELRTRTIMEHLRTGKELNY